MYKRQSSIISALNKIEKLKDIEVVVITRGGGSMEDLWGFNDEKLIRKAYDYEIPIISAIGHQVDYSLLDYVADMRCETPSTAAEFLSQEQTKLNQRMKISLQKLSLLFHNFKSNLQKRLDRVNPVRLSGVLQSRIMSNLRKLEIFNLSKRESLLKIKDNRRYIDELIENLKESTERQIQKNSQQLQIFEKSLYNLNPKQVLLRGYTYVSYDDNILDSSKKFKNVPSGSKLHLVFHDGKNLITKE